MAAQALLIEVGLLDDRWHGVGDWPPSPFRLFQALVAGAYGGRWATEDLAEKDEAFRWLESLAPPIIAAPSRTLARTTTHFVPINDLDTVDGDGRRIGEIRTAKPVRPSLLSDAPTFLYVWTFEGDAEEAMHLCALAERLHTFGRGLDAAYAQARVISSSEVAKSLELHGGAVSHPSGGAEGRADRTPCPMAGALQSLKDRHKETAARFETIGKGRKRELLLRQPPVARSRPVAYETPPIRLIYALRQEGSPARYRVLQTDALLLVEAVRDGAAGRLRASVPELGPLVERFLVGRGAEAGDSERRVRILALPTVGHPHASPSIRRVVVEIPADCPLREREIRWAFSGLGIFEAADPETGELASAAVLAPADPDRVTKCYGVGVEGARLWRSVTPVALPRPPGRGRTGGDRARAEAQAAGQVAAALRHAGVQAKPIEVRVQVEPFHAQGARADAFAGGRFDGRLRHVEVLFDQPVCGPLALGDGRFLGLGLMRQAKTRAPGLHVFKVDPATAPPADRREAVLRALRRAVMSRVQQTLGPGETLPLLFHGHDAAGAPARSGSHGHLFYAAWSSEGGDRLDRLAVVSPHLADRSVERALSHLTTLAGALAGLTKLRAGREGVLALTLLETEAVEAEPPFRAGRVWTSATPYRPTRHPSRGEDPAAAVAADLLAECARRGLPRPEVEVLHLDRGPRGGLAAQLRLRFTVEVAGPLLLGRDSHFGAGLFQLGSS